MRASPMNAGELALRAPLGEFTATQLRLEREEDLAAPSRKRILLLSASAGAGHVRAAQGLAAHAAQRDDVEVLHLDALEYVGPALRLLYRDFYLALVQRYPHFWQQIYHLTDRAPADGMLHAARRMVERLAARRLLRQVERLAPDAVICTHFLPAELLAHAAAKEGSSRPLWIQVTDFDLHRMWLQPGATGYFAANAEIASRLLGHGVARDRVHVTGIPVLPAFGQLPARADCARELGLDPQRTTLLVMGGGAGMGSLVAVAERMLDVTSALQLVVLAGRNQQALAALQQLAAAHPGRMAALGYTDRVDRIMACADLAVTKPGGLTISECLAAGLPMVLHAPIPGQEERNADFLLEQGAALKANDLTALEYRVKQLLRDPARLAAMAERARTLARSDAARRALEVVLGGCVA